MFVSQAYEIADDSCKFRAPSPPTRMTLRNFENFRCSYFEMHVAINRRHSVGLRIWFDAWIEWTCNRSRRLFRLWKHKGCYVFLACCFHRTSPKFEKINWIITWESRWFSVKWRKLQNSTCLSGIHSNGILCFTSWPTTNKCGICRMNSKSIEKTNELKCRMW